jgi:hypothetical protein
MGGSVAMRATNCFWSIGQVAFLAAIVLIGSPAQQSQGQVIEKSPTNAAKHQDAARSAGQETVVKHAGLDNGADQEKRCKASDLIGMKVRGLNADDNIGAINDIVLSQDGRVKYAVVSFGGFLGMGDTLFAVPFESIEFVKNGKEAHARIDVTKETLKHMKGFNKNTWPSEADHSFKTNDLNRKSLPSNTSR